MKFNVNKLILMMCVFCMSTVFGNSMVGASDKPMDLNRAQLESAKDFIEANNFSFTVPKNDGDPNYRVSVTLSVSGGSYCGERLWGLGDTFSDLTQEGCSDLVVSLDPGTYSVVLSDTYGDSWNNGFMYITAGGANLATFTCPSGVDSDDGAFHVESFTFTADDLPSCDEPAACNYGDAAVCSFPEPNEDCSGNCVAGSSLVTVTASASYSSYYSYIGYLIGSNGNYSGPFVPTSSSPSQDFCLLDGDNSLLTGSSSGYGWYGGTLTVTDESGDVIFGPLSQPTSGYEFTCTSSSDCTSCASDDSSCAEIEVGNEYPGIFLVSDFGVNVSCGDSTACNFGAAGNCTFPETNEDCDGNCIDSNACNGNDADAGSCTYPSSDDVNCDGSCGGVNGAVFDCAGTCGGTAVDSDWACDPTNIQSGSSSAGSTSGLIFDDGGLTGDYSNSSNNAYTITVEAGIIEIDVMSIDIENTYDTLWLCDGQGSPAWSPWNGTGSCTQFTNSGAGSSWASSGSVAGVYFESDSYGNGAGFQLSWSNNTDLCEDSNACNTGAVSACVYPAEGFDCSGDCLSGTKYSLSASCTYPSYYSYMSYFIDDGSEQLVSGSDPIDVCLADGLHSFNASSSGGYGWYGCTVTISDGNDMVFGPYTNTSGYEFNCTSDDDCVCSDTTPDCISVGGSQIVGDESFATTWHQVAFASGNYTCPDTAACNYDADGICVYPLNDNTNCDGTCGGVAGAVNDCAGVCGGSADPTSWDCDSSNMAYVDGQTLSDDTGSLMDPGGDLNYGDGELYSVTITNSGSGLLQLSFTEFEYESNSTCSWDYLMINDGGVETKYCGTTPGDGGVYTASGNSLTLTHKSDGSTNKAGFDLTWAYVTPGCTDTTACNYDSAAQVNDSSCTYPATNYDCAGDCLPELVDSCGQCAGSNASQDCAGTCSGSMAQGTFSLNISYDEGDTENEIYMLTAGGDNWDVENCSNFSASSGESLSFSADCNFASDFWSGAVSMTLAVGDVSTGHGTINLSGNGFSVSVEGAVDLNNSTGNTLIGDTNAVSVGGAYADNCNECDTDPSNDCVQDCSGEWGGTNALDGCGICGGLDASKDCEGTCSGTFAQGQFSLDISYADGDTQNEVYALTASGSNWSVSNCSDYVGDGGESGALSFSANCDLVSDFWVGPVSLALSVDDSSTGLGSISITGNGLSASLSGSIDTANSVGNTLAGDIQEGSVGGAPDNDSDGSCDDVDSDDDNDGTADVDDCNPMDANVSSLNVCGFCEAAASSVSCDGNCIGTLSAGTFSLSVGQEDAEGNDNATLSASGDNWSIADCGDWNAEGGDNTDLAFSAVCTLNSDFYVGSVSITLAVADETDGSGSVAVVGASFSTTLAGTVDDLSLFPNITGVLQSGDSGDLVDAGCGCGEPAATEYYNCNDTCIVDTDGDGVCDELEISGCTDSSSCTYNPNATESDDSCLYTDTCGFCDGGDANLDCAGDCSGDLADGSFTVLPGISFSGSAGDGSWDLSGCVLVSSTDTAVNDFVTSNVSTFDCDFTSNVFVGNVPVSSTQVLFAGSSNPAGYLFDVTLDGGNQFNFAMTAIISGSSDAGIAGAASWSDTFGLVGTGVDNKGTDCNDECGGSAAVDDCGICAAGTTGLITNANNLGCGCYNAAPLSYFEDADSDGLGSNGSDSVTYCLISDDCANVDGGCSSGTVPHTVVPGQPAGPDSCEDNLVNGSSFSDDIYSDDCAYYAGSYWAASYCDDEYMYDASTGTNVYADDACCSCGGGTTLPGTPATPDSYDFLWVLNDTDADDACASNVHDCNGVCDGPGNNTDTADGSCCVSGSVDCAGVCDSDLIGTGVDNKGTDCDDVCGGPAEVHGLNWTQGASASWSTDSQTSFTISDSNSDLVADDSDFSACFLAGETYEVSLCDTAGDGWSGSTLSIDDEVYSGPYSDFSANECLVTSFSLDGMGGCMSSEATNYDSSLSFDWDNGSCLWFAATPVNFTVTAEDSPSDYPGDIGFRISWDAVDHAQTYVLEYFDATEIGSACDYSATTAGIIACDGDCKPASWINDGFCDSYSDMDCAALDWDGEDCCEYSNQMQSDDPNGLCYQAANVDWAAECAAVNGVYCGEGNSASTVQNDCVASYFVCDGDNDCLDGSDEVLVSQGGDCADPVPGDSCLKLYYGNLYYGTLDCDLSCEFASTVSSYTGDGYCDSIDQPYGIYLDCAEFSYDDGDCAGTLASAGLSDFELVKMQHFVNNLRNDNLNIDELSKISLDEAYENQLINKSEYISYSNDMAYSNLPLLDQYSNDSSYEYRTPVGWITMGTIGVTEYFHSGFSYGDSREYRVATLTNSGIGVFTDGDSDTVPLLTAPTNLSIVAGPQDPNDINSYEYVNLLWEYPTFQAPPFPDCAGNPAGIGDGFCEAANNNELCGYDGGDCCADSCDATLDTYSCTECEDCGTQADDGWSSCYDPSNGGSGVPTCNDDYQFGAVVAECYNYSNTLELYWNTGCSGQINLNGTLLVANTDVFNPPIILWGLNPDVEQTLEFIVDGEVVATEVETSSDEDCAGPVANCGPLAVYSASNIGDGYCSGIFNSAECDWDGGDCCPGDCEGSDCSWYGGECPDCVDPDSADLAEGGQCYVAPCYGVSISSTNDSWCNEVSWKVLSAEGYTVAQGGCNANVCLDSLAPGWTVELSDSYNDGWSGCVLTVDGVDFQLNSGGFACYDSTGAACPTDGGGGAPVCGSECPAGQYFDGGSCYGCDFCVNTYDDSACSSDTGNDCCGACGGSASGDCSGTLAAGTNDDLLNSIKDARIELNSMEENSKEWWSMYKKLNGGAVITDGPESDLIDRDAISSIPEFDMVSEDLIGLITQFEYKLNIFENSNSQEYRAAEGFVVYSVDSDGSTSLIGSTTTAPQFTVTSNTVGCYAVGAYDSSPSFYSELSSTVCIDAYACPVLGDVTQDGLVNVSDIVYLVNSILGSGLDAGCADMNGDGSVNVSDVVALVNVILNPRTASFDDASETVLLVSDDSLKLQSNGFVQGVQLTLSHDSGFEIELSDAYVSEYKTTNNETTLMIVTDGSHSINDIATFSGDMIIESIHVVNQSGDVTVEETVELANFEVKVTGPNPFNPSTQLNIVVPEAGFVSVNVYNILGQKVATLVDGYMDASSAGHMVNFNASHLASGVYLVRAVTANDIATQKLMLLK